LSSDKQNGRKYQTKQLIVILTALLLFNFLALAADDATGNWKATIDTPNGMQMQTFALKLEGREVTGTIGSEMLENMQIRSRSPSAAIMASFAMRGLSAAIR
jgi:hypothetical protein